MTMTIPSRINLLAALCGVFLVSCAKESANHATGKPAGTASPALEKVLLNAMPAAAVDVSAAVPSAKAGEEIVVQGRLLGAEKVFVENRAAFVLGDSTKLTACSDKAGDTCPTPWDACCDAKEVIRTAVATIQVVDGKGTVLKESVKGLGGLTELSNVVIKGTVATASGNGVLIVNATGIFVVPAK